MHRLANATELLPRFERHEVGMVLKNHSLQPWSDQEGAK